MNKKFNNRVQFHKRKEECRMLKILNKVNEPKDLKTLSQEELKKLGSEIKRHY